MTRRAETEGLRGMHPAHRSIDRNRVILISKMTRRYKAAAAVSSIATFAVLAYAFGRLLGTF